MSSLKGTKTSNDLFTIFKESKCISLVLAQKHLRSKKAVCLDTTIMAKSPQDLHSGNPSP